MSQWMLLKRRLRGVIGTALTWAGLGALVGIPTFLAVMRPWPLSVVRWERLLDRFLVWELAAMLWGAACGAAFSAVILILERTQRLQQLSPRRVTIWGGIAGAVFPAILLIGAAPSYFGLIVGASSLTGAVWARLSLSIAKRASEDTAVPATLGDGEMPLRPIAQPASDPVDRAL